MLPLTADELRLELQHFANNTLQRQLADFATAIREGVRFDSQHTLNSSSRSCQLLQAELSPSHASVHHLMPPTPIAGPNPDAYHLPGQPPHIDIDVAQDVCSPISSIEKDRSDEEQSGIHKLAWGSTVSTSESDDAAQQVQFEESDKNLLMVHALVPVSEEISNELKQSGYYKSVTRSMTQALPTKEPKRSITLRDTAKQMMLDGLTGGTGRSESESAISSASCKSYDAFVRHSPVRQIVCSDKFEQCILFVIGLNAIFLAVETEVAVSDYTLSRTPVFKIIDLVFLIVFAIELGLRIYVWRCSFFKSETPYGAKNMNQAWNIFDCFVVGIQALEMLFCQLSDTGSVFGSIIVLRLFRILRIGRLLRVQKILRMFKFLRIIVTSIYHSISAFFWAVVSLEVIIFVFAVYFTELTAVERQSGDQGEDDLQARLDMHRYFGSLFDSQLSLLKAVTGGIDWGDLEPCLRYLGIMPALVPFLGYLMFMLLVTMNVFTGIFLDSASQRVQHEREIHLVKAAHQIFKASDFDNSDKISRADFKKNLTHPDVHDFFEAIDLDIQQAEVLFSLLDTTGDGVVSYDEFLRGCLRLRGTSKALDLLILSREVTHLFDKVGAIVNSNSESLRMNRRMLTELHVLAKASKGQSAKVHDL